MRKHFIASFADLQTVVKNKLDQKGKQREEREEGVGGRKLSKNEKEESFFFLLLAGKFTLDLKNDSDPQPCSLSLSLPFKFS